MEQAISQDTTHSALLGVFHFPWCPNLLAESELATRWKPWNGSFKFQDRAGLTDGWMDGALKQLSNMLTLHSGPSHSQDTEFKAENVFVFHKSS